MLSLLLFMKTVLTGSMYCSKGGQCYILDKSPPGPVDKVIGFSNTLAGMLASFETEPGFKGDQTTQLYSLGAIPESNKVISTLLIYFIVSLWSSLLCTFSPSVSCQRKGWVYPLKITWKYKVILSGWVYLWHIAIHWLTVHTHDFE